MNKFIFTLSFAVIVLFSFNSCNTYTSLTNASSVSQLSGNPFVQNVAKSVIKNITNSLVQNGIKNVAGKLGLSSNLSSILSTAQAVSGFKNMLSNNYGIASTLIDQKYSKMMSIKDVVSFVAKNANKGISFYKN